MGAVRQITVFRDCNHNRAIEEVSVQPWDSGENDKPGHYGEKGESNKCGRRHQSTSQRDD